VRGKYHCSPPVPNTIRLDHPRQKKTKDQYSPPAPRMLERVLYRDPGYGINSKQTNDKVPHGVAHSLPRGIYWVYIWRILYGAKCALVSRLFDLEEFRLTFDRVKGLPIHIAKVFGTVACWLVPRSVPSDKSEKNYARTPDVYRFGSIWIFRVQLW
jgi:hypothetical protein